LKQERASILHSSRLPHFNYCSETWHFCSKSATAKLEKVSERAVRFVFNEKQTRNQELLNKIGLPSLPNQRLAKIVCMVYKAINHDHAPKSIKKLLDFRNTRYDLRETDILKLPKVNIITYGLKSWGYLAPKLWSLLPESDRTIQTFTAFKNSIKKIDLAGLSS